MNTDPGDLLLRPIPLRTPRVAWFDIENEPTSFRERFPLTKPIAIAAGWDASAMWHWAKGGRQTLAQGLTTWREKFYEPADMVAGHNIRDHDLPIINAAMLRCDLPPLGAKLTLDTLRDLVPLKGVGRSLEALCVYFGLDEHKHHIAEAEWEDLWSMDTPARRAEVVERCSSDVRINMALGKLLANRGWLKPPKVWRTWTTAARVQGSEVA
jgi:hypothetical protein